MRHRTVPVRSRRGCYWTSRVYVVDRGTERRVARHRGRNEKIHVREHLRQADPALHTVTETAYRYGFTHMGRFAAEYRARFGEAPSTTLGR